MTYPVEAPRVRLVRADATSPARRWDVLLPAQGTYKVTGEAGSGVTSFLINTAVARIVAGADPSSVLFLTSSKDAAARVRRDVGRRLVDSGFSTEEPIARSVHSLAFALLRQQEGEQIRLISGAEQDLAIRELLAGHDEWGTGSWPQQLRPALPLVGFARQLRDFMLRAIERGAGPEELRRAGQKHKIPVWSATGDFLAEYQEVMALYGTKSYSASELIAEVLRREIPAKWTTLIVDDAQHLSPAAASLVQRLSGAADLTVVGGDLEQSVFHFRGASPDFFRDFAAETVNLGPSRREPDREAVIVADAPSHLSVVVDTVRREHLEEDVPWSDIAVVVRSASMIDEVRRALLQAGVPVALDPTDVVLAEQPLVKAMLLGLRALTGELSTAQWRELIIGPVGGSDPVSLRRLLRGLRRWDPQQRSEETLGRLIAAEELPDFGSVLTPREEKILTRIRRVLEAGRTELAAGESVENVLWAIWSATGLSDSLMASALRGGAAGSQADRDLDSMMALFDAAGDFTERRPQAGVEAFIAHIEEQELPTSVRDRRVALPEAVPVLTAHGVVGREFATVVVAGVQEGSWPQLTETGSLFRQEDFIDYVDSDIDPAVPVSHIADRLAEERRLFHVATTRATKRVVVSAVDAPDGDELIEPSRFVNEFADAHGTQIQRRLLAVEPQEAESQEAEPVAAGGIRVLARDELVAELRSAITDPSATEVTRAQAARQLARLAEAGIDEAVPDSWWALTQPSISEPLEPKERLSPSRIEGLLNCPMRDVLEREVAPSTGPHMTKGTLAHAYFEALGRGADAETAREMTLQAYSTLFEVPPWQVGVDRAEFTALLEASRAWLRSSRKDFEQVGVEVPVRVKVADTLTISGRMDRLERSGGRLHIVDLKTGKSAPTVADTQDNPQLAAYQLALAHGQLVETGEGVAVETFDDPGKVADVDGATLVYPASGKKGTTRKQDAASAEQREAFLELIRDLPNEMTGPQLTAKTGPHCDHCTVRALCPVMPEGDTLVDG